MAAKIVYLSDEEFEILVTNLNFGSTSSDSINIEHKLIFMRDKFKETETPTKHTMTRAEALAKFSEAIAGYHSAEKVIDFYVAAGMLELKEEEEKPMFEIISPEQVLHIKIWENGKIDGISGTVINRIPELIAKLKQNNS